jgi:(p)ppGpp synthase/HD superfamily hydrolase
MTLDFKVAWQEAETRHAGQMYGKHKYTYHLEAVVAAVRLIYGDDVAMQVAAALHDTVEDTGATREYLTEKYGELVGTLVWAVSADPNAKGRRAKQQSIVDKILSLSGEVFYRAINLKLCDRKCNMKAAIEEQRWDLVRMYQREEPLYGSLFARGDAAAYAEFCNYCAFVIPKH